MISTPAKNNQLRMIKLEVWWTWRALRVKLAAKKVSPEKRRVDMRVLLLYLLPLLLLVASLFVIGQRRQGESQPQDEETSNASVFLKILAIGGCVAVALLLAIELN